jgi:hypothetical protein
VSAPTLAGVTVTPAAVVADAWQVYRRAELVPAAAELIQKRAALHSLLDPHCLTYGKPLAAPEPDVAAIEDAVDALVAAVEWHCGTGAAAFVAGDSEGRPAA